MNLNIMQHLFQQQKWNLCIESCLKIIMQDKTNIEAWSTCALSYGHLGKLNEAIECLQEALKIDKKHGGAHLYNLSLNLAEFYRRNGMTLQAIALLKSFLPRDDENLHFNLAKCYGDLQDYEQSIQHYMVAIQINPKDIHALFNLANQEAAIGRFSLALKYYTLAYEGGMGDAGINLAQIYVSLDKLDEAIALYENLESGYKEDSNFYFNYANALRYHLDFDKAKAYYYQALALQNNPHYAINLAYLLLSLNDFGNGFSFYEYRKFLINKEIPKHFLNFSFQNKDKILQFIKDKKVALYHEQGFGDSIMFMRFIPLIECKEKVLFVPKELLKLFSSFGIACSSHIQENYDIAIPLPSLGFLYAQTDTMQEVLYHCRNIIESFLQQDSLQNQAIRQKIEQKKEIQQKEFNHDWDTIHKLPHHLPLEQSVTKETKIPIQRVLESYEVYKNEKTTQNLKQKIKQTQPPSKYNQAYQLQLATMGLIKKIKVGLNFASNPKFQNAREKSIYPQKLLESLPKDGFEYYSLQYEGLDSNITQEFNIIDLKDCIHDFCDSARILMQMDIVVSIDSALAHLSGTLGIPTALLLYKRHDWRWGELGKHTTIWYENVSLLIQKNLHEWESVLNQLKDFLLSMKKD